MQVRSLSNKQEKIRQSHASHLLSCFIEIPYQNLLLCKTEGRNALMDQFTVASFDIYLPRPKYIFQRFRCLYQIHSNKSCQSL